MDLSVAALAGKPSVAQVNVSDVVFAADYNEGLIHQVITAYMAGSRAGTKAQKTRSEVRGGGRKPWAQKGTGRARAGTIRSPIFRKGGVTFAAKPRDFTQKVNKKMYKAAIRSIISELIRLDRLKVIDSIFLDEPKTGVLVKYLNGISVGDVLIVTHDLDENLYLAARNLHKVEVVDVPAMDPVSLVGHANVMITVEAMKQLEEKLV